MGKMNNGILDDFSGTIGKVVGSNDAYREWQNANKNKMQPRGPRGRILKAAKISNGVL
jgi:hypothetical protein